MFEFIQPLSLLAGSWLSFFLLFSGLGLALMRILRLRILSGWRWLDCFWLGWALTLLILQLWHVAFPVDDLILLVMAAVAAWSLWSARRDLQAQLRTLRRERAFLLLFGALTLFFASRAIEMPTAYDTGWRDMQAVMWIDRYPIVPGLANLYSSLAYNHSSYLYNALIENALLQGRSLHIGTGLLLLAYLAQAIGAALALWRGRAAGLRWSHVFAMLTIPYVLYFTVARGGLSHFLTDTVVDLLGFLTLIYLLDFAQEWRAGCRDGWLLLRLAVIVCAGLSVKQTYIVFGLACALAAAVIWLRRGGLAAGRRKAARLCGSLALLAAAFVVPWMARGLITSGYIAYPLSIGRVELDWTLPASQIEARQRALATNTRQRHSHPEQVLSSWDWLGPWLARLGGQGFYFVLPMAISAVSLLILAVGRLRMRHAPSGLGLWILLPTLGMLVFWFFSFPNPKYANYLFWSLAALSALLAALEWRRLGLAWSYTVLAICLVYLVVAMLRGGILPLPAGPVDGFYYRVPPLMEIYETDSGLQLTVPRGAGQCWALPLPCTPHPKPGITARAPGDLGAGFGQVSSSGRG